MTAVPPCPSPASYTLQEVRDLVAGTSFQEINHNEQSKAISFRSGTTTINVYYTTGTIGTCLDHPTQGKTQLFRRNVNLQLLALMFRNPRILSAKGYYTRMNNRQSWKTRNKDGREVSLVDSAVRWLYVASATGLSTQHSELLGIAAFCNAWDSMYWSPGSAPKLSQTRFSCGSKKGLSNMLLEAARQVWGRPVRGMYFGNGGQEDREDVELGHCCGKLDAFLKVHSHHVTLLKGLLQGFRRDVQIELMRWFFARDHCGYALIDYEFAPVLTPFSSSVDCAHIDYANLNYTKEDIAEMCRMHGVLFEPA